MAKKLIIEQDERLGPWICAQLETDWLPGRGSCIGMEEDGDIVAGVLFDSFNGASICMHVAALPGKRWMNRELLWTCFAYPFLQLRVRKILGFVAEGNRVARAFDEHLGFVREATLTNAHPSGALIVYSMTRSQCRWLEEGSHHGEAESSAAA